jgi:FMN phosphatase YigB (HAD superfamily)
MLENIKALTFDTGGTILDWHHGLSRAFATAGAGRGLQAAWPAITNAYRRRSLQAILDAEHPTCTIDDVHREMLDATAARWLALAPHEILMVACHNFDFMAARAAGYHSAFVRRPMEWGPSGPPDPVPNPAHDLVVDTFFDLARQLGA